MIYEALKQYFEASGLDIEEHPDAGWVGTEGFGQNGSWVLVGQAYEDRDQAVIYSVLPEKVPAERRPAMMELQTRINFRLVLGDFVLDLEDGEVRFKASLDFGGREPDEALLKPVVATALLQFDRWLPSLRDVIGGGDPAEAFARGAA